MGLLLFVGVILPLEASPDRALRVREIAVTCKNLSRRVNGSAAFASDAITISKFCPPPSGLCRNDVGQKSLLGLLLVRTDR